jgi:hypothetical protein
MKVSLMMQKDKKYWFVAKDYGWGWVPATIQGWLILVVYCVIITGIAIGFTDWVAIHPVPSLFVITVFILVILLITSSLIYICYKTGEPPEWRWGKKK